MTNNRKAQRADKPTPLPSSRAPGSKRRPRQASGKFSKTIREKLGHYVYRLVDPRTEETFYVGKGTNNRVFDHINSALKPTKGEDELDLKTELIREIRKAGLPVTAIIHRHGLVDKEMALEVEAALIDAYPELTNIQSGHGSAVRGGMTVEQVKAFYDAPEAKFGNIKAVIIKIRQTVVDEKKSVYEAVRAAWRIDPKRAKNLPVVASVGGVIKGVFTDVKWHKSAKYEGRFEFTAEESRDPGHLSLLSCRLPDKYCKKGQANPIRYT
ncbi:MAG: hypothetical protein IKQ55_10845 [Kiritimatiellae bacterium]|nr:hypothetical protein [Kiritimatiellia bacterium]